MRNQVLSYCLAICAAGLMMGTVACGRSDSGMTNPSNMSHGTQNTMSNNMDSNMGNSMSNGVGH
jgi:hypothetical protein